MKRLCFILIYLVIFGCNANQPYIIPYDMEKHFPDRKNGLTQNEINEWFRKGILQTKVNTEGKKMPAIRVTNPKGQPVILNNMIHQRTLLFGTDSHCGWGLDVLENDLPNALEKLKGDSVKLFTIVLLVRDKMDSAETRSFTKLVNEVEPRYEHFYIIEKQEAKKLNMMNATKMMVGGDQTVISWDIGAFLDPNRLYEELKSKLSPSSHRPGNR